MIKIDIDIFDFNLPSHLIAQHPNAERDDSRLMIIDRNTCSIEHRKFKNVIDYLKKGDVLVLNNTKVIPARLFGRKEVTGGSIEVLLLRRYDTQQLNGQVWEVLFKPAKRVKKGDKIIFCENLLTGEVVDKEEGLGIVNFKNKGDFFDVLNKVGKVPLPPYIKRTNISGKQEKDIEKLDCQRYQTIYADQKGAVAAPTAGLHFTHELLEKIKQKGVEVVFVTLHVSWGTFQPIRCKEIGQHKMYKEYYEIDQKTASKINLAKQSKNTVFCVGTTTVRALESSSEEGEVRPVKGFTDIFIYPGYKFKVVDALITNFHLPQSTLLMLVCSFACLGKTKNDGIEFILKSYNEAIKNNYRFYSFGDAMLVM